MSASVDVSKDVQAVTPVSGQIYQVQNVAYTDHILANYASKALDGNPIVSWPRTSASKHNQFVRALTFLTSWF